MRSWVVEKITEAGEMVWVERPDPVPGRDEFLVRVNAAGVNFADTLMTRGLYQRKPETPFTPGIEVAGEIVGADASDDRRGRVCANIPTGGFAELALVPARVATTIPDDVPSDIALALLGVNYPTAYYALHYRAQIRSGETVLVHAGAGGVGSAALQIALAHGCRPIAVAGSQEKLAICRELGAETVVSYESADWESAVRAVTGTSRIQIDQVRLLVLHAAWKMNEVGNKESRREIAEIKVAAANMACEVVDRAIRAFGGAGVTEDFGLSYMYKYARTLRIVDGPDEVHRHQLGRQELAKYSPARVHG